MTARGSRGGSSFFTSPFFLASTFSTFSTLATGRAEPWLALTATTPPAANTPTDCRATSRGNSFFMGRPPRRGGLSKGGAMPTPWIAWGPRGASGAHRVRWDLGRRQGKLQARPSAASSSRVASSGNSVTR